MDPSRLKPLRSQTLSFALAFVIVTLASRRAGSFDSGFSAFGLAPAARSVTWNGLSGGQQLESGKGMTALQAMLWKYVARCALPAGQDLQAPATAGTKPLKFPGLFGLAPEWRDGTCDEACQEKVSACLIALTNRTGKHVLVSLLSGDPAMGETAAPSENDLGFPHQEGTFFGNVFSNQAYACQGHDVRKGPQVKRFCALEPRSCSGIAQFVDVGPCQAACQMSCLRLSDGTERCAARSCKDPQGKQWGHPVTTYLRNQIEAANADTATGATIKDEGLDALDAGDHATFELIDFGSVGQPMKSFAADLEGHGHKGRIEIWADSDLRLGSLDIPAPARGGGARRATASIDASSLTGPHRVTLKVVAGKDVGRLTTFELR